MKKILISVNMLLTKEIFVHFKIFFFSAVLKKYLYSHNALCMCLFNIFIFLLLYATFICVCFSSLHFSCPYKSFIVVAFTWIIRPYLFIDRDFLRLCGVLSRCASSIFHHFPTCFVYLLQEKRRVSLLCKKNYSVHFFSKISLSLSLSIRVILI